MPSGPEHLRDWMRRRDMNQREAAALLGITEVYLSQLLNGHRQPGLPNAIKIERITGIAVEGWLLTGVSDTEPAAVGASAKRRSTKR